LIQARAALGAAVTESQAHRSAISTAISAR
jgi:hypothetical protein